MLAAAGDPRTFSDAWCLPHASLSMKKQSTLALILIIAAKEGKDGEISSRDWLEIAKPYMDPNPHRLSMTQLATRRISMRVFILIKNPEGIRKFFQPLDGI